MSGKRQAENLDESSPAKKQKVSNGVTSNGAPTTAPPRPALPAMEAIAKAKRALELQKQLKAKLEAAKLKVRHTQLLLRSITQITCSSCDAVTHCLLSYVQ